MTVEGPRDATGVAARSIRRAGGGFPPAVAMPARRSTPPVVRTNAVLLDRSDLTADVATFRVRPDAPAPPFEPGQYFSLGLEIDGRFVLRPYSTASPAGARDDLEFLIRRVPGGSFTAALWAVRPGSPLWIGPPKGLFTLQPHDDRAHLLVSTGTGLAPFLSMADALLSDSELPRRRVVVVHGASLARELAYAERLSAWATEDERFAYLPAVSRPSDLRNDGWTGATGRVDAILDARFGDLGLDPASTVAYVCGNPGMIAAVAAVLRAHGLHEAAVLREQYWPDPAS